MTKDGIFLTSYGFTNVNSHGITVSLLDIITF